MTGVDAVEDEDEAANAELAAAQSLDWGDWSGTDDEEEVDTYFSIVLDPWREDEAEEQLREVNAGLATVNLDPSKTTPKPVLAKCPDCKDSTFTTIEGYVKHRVGHGMQGMLSFHLETSSGVSRGLSSEQYLNIFFF